MASVQRERDMDSIVERRPESQQLFAEILDAATRLFSERGFMGTTTQELADAVGLVKGTLYYHIGSKDELLYHIHQRVTEEGIRRWSDIIDEGADDDAAELVGRMILEHCVMMDQHRDAIAVFSEEMKFLPPDLLARVVERRDMYHDLLEGVIRRGVARGEFNTDPRLATVTLLGMLNSMYRWYQPKGRLTPTRIGRLMTTIALDGIAAS